MPTLQRADRSEAATSPATSDEALYQAALDASKNAYAPYSHLRVGAALVSEQGKVYSGCNVENVSFSLVSCAERNAIAAAVRAEGQARQEGRPFPFKIKAIAVAARDSSGQPIHISPCGACRQAIREFAVDADVIYTDSNGTLIKRPISELLPDSFSSLMP